MARSGRYVLYSFAACYVVLRVLQYFLIRGWGWQILPGWFLRYVYLPLNSPLPIIIRDFFLFVGLSGLTKRAGVRWFEGAYEWVLVFGLLRAILGIVEFFPYQYLVEEIAWLVIYPVAVATLCIYVTILMLKSAREAQANWVSD